MLVALAYGSQTPDCAAAAHTPLHEYCYKQVIAVTTDNSTWLDGHGVRFEYDAANTVLLDQIGARAHDLRPNTTGLDEVEVTAQDMDATAAPWWIRTPTVSLGSTVQYPFYTANKEARRNQGIFFTGFDLVTVPAHANFDLTDNLALEVELEVDNADSISTSSTVIGKWSADQGYRLTLSPVSATDVLLTAQVDNQTTAYTWAGATTSVFRLEFENPNLSIWENGAQVATANTGLGSVTTVADDLLIGASSTELTIRYASVRANLDTTETVVAGWGFHPHQMSEETAVDPLYTGFIADQVGSQATTTAADLSAATSTVTVWGNHPAAYSFTRDQSGITAALGAISPTSAPLVVDLSAPLVSVFTDPFANVSLFTTSNENINLPFFSIFDYGADNLNIPSMVFWAGVSLVIGYLLMLFTTSLTEKPVFGIVASAVPAFLAIVSGLMPAWILLMWILLMLGVYTSGRWERQA
jgi:hypothetical protein|tara:strand:- start:1141 stop:2550 length:1410 start_codon:yes stop_codon:yes gene_type:complete